MSKPLAIVAVVVAATVPSFALAHPHSTEYKNAAKLCKAERTFLGREVFRQEYGTNRNKSNAFGKCVSRQVHRKQELTKKVKKVKI